MPRTHRANSHSFAAVLWAAFRRAPRAALTRERLAAAVFSSPRRAFSRTAGVRWPHIKAITTRYRN
jgi:hypothetical protein